MGEGEQDFLAANALLVRVTFPSLVLEECKSRFSSEE